MLRIISVSQARYLHAQHWAFSNTYFVTAAVGWSAGDVGLVPGLSSVAPVLHSVLVAWMEP